MCFIGQRPEFDERDQKLLDARIEARNTIPESRNGDFVRFRNGKIERISHDWEDEIQTSPIKAGSFYLGREGSASFSGSLNPSIPVDSLTLTPEVRQGAFWFFHHDWPGAGQGVSCTAPCRVFDTSAEYRGFLTTKGDGS